MSATAMYREQNNEATRRFLLKVHDLLIRATRRHPGEPFTKQKIQ
jgi:hypothetical protein